MQFNPSQLQSIHDRIHKCNPRSPHYYVCNERLFSQGKKQKGRKNYGDLRNNNFRLYPLDLKAMPQLAPAFGSRGGGGGGGFFEGTMGVCSASAWLNSSSSDEDGEADNGEPRGE
jgi:hypothetical protein